MGNTLSKVGSQLSAAMAVVALLAALAVALAWQRARAAEGELAVLHDAGAPALATLAALSGDLHAATRTMNEMLRPGADITRQRAALDALQQRRAARLAELEAVSDAGRAAAARLADAGGRHARAQARSVAHLQAGQDQEARRLLQEELPPLQAACGDALEAALAQLTRDVADARSAARQRQEQAWRLSAGGAALAVGAALALAVWAPLALARAFAVQRQSGAGPEVATKLLAARDETARLLQVLVSLQRRLGAQQKNPGMEAPAPARRDGDGGEDAGGVDPPHGR